MYKLQQFLSCSQINTLTECHWIPNIPENKRNRRKTKRGRKQIYDQVIADERFNTIERTFAWEDKFKRLLLRFEFHSIHHYAMKTIAYAMINLRHFCY